MSYIDNNINEGFDILSGRKLRFNPRHNNVLNTDLDGEPTKSVIHSVILDKDIDVYSVFKRMQLKNPDNPRAKRTGDSNPVIYSLKGERGWKFENDGSEEQFWRVFEHIMRRWLREHKNEFNTAVMVPTSSKINRRIMDMIQKLSEEVGITSFITRGLVKLDTTEIENMALDKESYFYKFWTGKGKYDEAFDKLMDCLDEMDVESEGRGTFKYHLIPDMSLRKTVLDTIKWDEQYKDVYADELNSSNVLIVDDSITNGFSAESTIKAISNLYTPKSVSVLTMFSKLYDADGNEISRKEEIPEWLLDEDYVIKRKIYNKVMNEIAMATKNALNKIDID